MPSSKGKPTDPKLREKVKEDVKNETNKDGGGKGQWSAWKAAKLSKEYEKKGGSYENEAGSKNEPKKGEPTPKSSSKKKKEEEKAETESTPSPEDKENDKPKANTSAKKAKPDEEKDEVAKKGKGGRKKAGEGTKKAEKPKAVGTRQSARVAGKRGRDEDGGQEKGGKKRKST